MATRAMQSAASSGGKNVSIVRPPSSILMFSMRREDSVKSNPLPCGFGLVCQLGPDAAPGALTEHLTVNLSSGLLFDAARVGWVHVSPACEALVQISVAGADLLGQRPSSFGGYLRFHGAKSSIRLAFVKP